MICFEVHLIGVTPGGVTDVDFIVRIDDENIEWGDSDVIHCFSTRKKVGTGGDSEWDEGDEIYEHDKDEDYWGGSVETTAFRSTGTKTVDLGSTGDDWFNSYWLSGGFSGYMTFWVRESGHENDERVKCWSREYGGGVWPYTPRLEVQYSSVGSTIRCDTLVDACEEKEDGEIVGYEPQCRDVDPACDWPFDHYDGDMCGCDNGDPRVQIGYDYSDYGVYDGAEAYLFALGYCRSWYEDGGFSDWEYTYSINGDCRYQTTVNESDAPYYRYIRRTDGPEPNPQPPPFCGNGALIDTCPREAVEEWHRDF